MNSEKLQALIKSYGKYLLGTLLIGVSAYFAMMAEELNNNYDGIWHLSNFIAGDFEISLGRGLERYADRARFGVVSSPLNALLCLLCLSASLVLIIRRFRLENTFFAWLLIFLLTVNPALCDTLSYSYLAVNYLLACLFSVVSFYFLSADCAQDRKKRLWLTAAGALFLAFSMALYQAYFSVLCTLLLFYGIRQILRLTDLRKLLLYYVNAFAGILLGGVLYLLLTKALLFRAGTALADYKGASGITPLAILLALPASFARCCREAFAYAFTWHFRMNLEFSALLSAALLILFIAASALQSVRLFRGSRPHLILFLLSLLLLPAAGCAVLFIAIGNTMTGIMETGLLLCVVLSALHMPAESKRQRSLRAAYLALLAVFGWYALFTVTNDQLALREGRTASVSLARNIVSELARENLLSEGQPVALIGRPSENPLFHKSAAFQQANEYAQFGAWSTDPRNSRVSWYGVLANYLGVTLPLCDDATFDTLRRTPSVAAMPVFPADGSIAVQDGVIVVKVSDLYD